MAVLAIVGGQYGSEGKGVIVSKLSGGATCAVRTGGPNAGHSIIHEGRVWKMRSVPCSWVNPKTHLIIGPGAVLNGDLLAHEINEIEAAGYSVRDRLWVDPRATLITQVDENIERLLPVTPLSGGPLTDRIGSTGEGVGEARVRKIRRDPDHWQSVEELGLRHGITVRDTLPKVNIHALAGQLLLEGTQGYGLSLSLGRWPFVTSANCTAAQLMSDAGVGMVGVFETVIVFRSYPIRVGGNSGSLPGEMNWAEMSHRVGIELIPERTTVTNKIRRIGTFDWDMAREAVMANGATEQVLTFADYLDPACAGETQWHKLPKVVRAFVDQMEDTNGIPVAMVGTGGPAWSVCTRPPALVRSGHPQLRQDHARN